jgi:hypothetical protein
MTTTVFDPETMARSAMERVHDLVLRFGAPAVIVDSPPGAGKTHLVESLVAVAAAHAGLRVAIAVPQNEQVYDLLRRLAAGFPPMNVQPLLSASRDLPPDVGRLPELLPVANRVTDLHPDWRIIVGTVSKLGLCADDLARQQIDLLVCDEAYQIAFKDFLPLALISPQVLLVGDPGQLPPLVRIEDGQFEGAPYKVHWPAPREIANRQPATPIVKLPVTRRLPQDTVDILQPSHYPGLPFVSAADTAERKIDFAARGLRDPVDRALDMLAEGNTVVGLLLPSVDYPIIDVDEEVSELMARVVQRAHQRHISMGGARLSLGDIGCADAHVASNAATARRLRSKGVSTDDVVCETPEQWQGLQRKLMIVKHPLSGKHRLSAFDLDPGRWCVMLSRHLGACIIVGREGIGAALNRHQHDCAGRPMKAIDGEWRGWNAHQKLWGAMVNDDRFVLA